MKLGPFLTQTMRLIATDAALPKILSIIVRGIESENPGTLCSILLLDRAGTHLLTGAAPSLPEFYNQAIHGLPIGPEAGSCGTAAFFGKRIIVKDIKTDPLWKDYTDLAAKANLDSCWSEPIRGTNGKVLGTFAIYHPHPHSPSEADIETIINAAQVASIAIERKQTVEALRALAEERASLLTLEREARSSAERANHIKDEFIATLSHELRTPLTTIMSWAQLLNSGKLDAAKTKRGVEILLQSAKAQGQLIDDLLDISRIQAGKLNMDLQEIDPLKPVSAAIELTHNLAMNKGILIELEANLQGKLIPADPVRLQQVFWNLITNSIKFTPQGGKITIKIDRVTSPSEEHLEIKVCDTGKGIKPEFLPKIFERFTQAESTSTRAYGGLGLGLAIVRNLVEMHEGTVQATSPGENKGSIFTISLPVKTGVHKNPLQVNKHDPVIDTTTDCMKGLRILLVEDEPSAREVFAIMIQSFGAEVSAVGSAAEALSSIEKFNPNILISDIAMPDEDGYSLIRRVRAMPTAMARVPALALTAFARESDVEEARSAGFQTHLAKPVDADTLARTVVRLVKGIPKILKEA